MPTIAELHKKLKSETDDQRKHIFNKLPGPDGEVTFQKTKMPQQEAKLRSFQQPKVLLNRHLLTQGELDDHSWTETDERNPCNA